jgi:hypothetical protein
MDGLRVECCCVAVRFEIDEILDAGCCHYPG